MKKYNEHDEISNMIATAIISQCGDNLDMAVKICEGELDRAKKKKLNYTIIRFERALEKIKDKVMEELLLK